MNSLFSRLYTRTILTRRNNTQTLALVVLYRIAHMLDTSTFIKEYIPFPQLTQDTLS